MLNFLAAVSGNGAGGGGSFESIATATGTGSSSTISFTNIPSTYQHLQIRALMKGTSTAFATFDVRLKFNNNSVSANYVNHYLRGTGSAAQAGQFSSTTDGFVIALSPDSITSSPNLTNIMGTAIIDIHDYASTTKNKTVRSFGGVDGNVANTSFQTYLQSGLWINTNAVTRIDLWADLGQWTTTTTFALYGIKGA